MSYTQLARVRKNRLLAMLRTMPDARTIIVIADDLRAAMRRLEYLEAVFVNLPEWEKKKGAVREADR